MIIFFALFVKAECRLSFRRTNHFLKLLGIKVASKSTLQRYSYKLKLNFWQKIFNFTIDKKSKIVSIDGTGLSKSSPSQYYIKRIDSQKKFCKGYHFSIIVDEDSKIVSLRIRKNFTHDIKDVKYLVKRIPFKPEIILMDKGYDSENLHKFFALQYIWS